MIVRECYSRILSIILKKLEKFSSGGGALLFSGGQGNGKVRVLGNADVIVF
jgi:hypothetical protein